MAENGHVTGHLTTVQRKARDALIAGASKHQADLVAGRSRRTLDRWIQDEPSFRDALRVATNAAVSDASRRMATMLDDCLTALQGVIDEPSSNRDILRATQVITNSMIRLREFGELEERIRLLEERATDEPKWAH